MSPELKPRFLTAEDGDTILERVFVKGVEILVPYASWGELEQAVEKMERQASSPCFCCVDDCGHCSYRDNEVLIR